MPKLPYFAFYPADWRKDPGVQSLTFHDRGVWFEMLCLMHESDQRGKLMLNGKPMPLESLARLLGLEQQVLTNTLTTLLDSGVASRCPRTGALVCRRMVRDEALRQTRKKSGALGGNPLLLNQKPTKVDNPPVIQSSEAASVIESSSRGSAEGERVGPEWETVKRWLADWQKNGADYTEFETKGAFLALQANGWMWGRNHVVDPRAALERQIQTDRERKQVHGTKDSKTANPRLAGVSRNPINNYAEAAKRKMAGQMDSPQNGPPSKAEGT